MGEPGPLPPCPHCRAQHPEELLLCPTTNRLLPLEGRVLDHRFRFIKQLGEGGMSTVWMAENFRVRKRVAIKVMHPEFARNPRTLHRFQNEATAAGRIGNPHICDILDLGESPLGPYIVMEMLQGQSLGELLDDQGRIDPPLAVLIICEALTGLAAAHAVGIIHRDLKPENVFLHEPAPGRMLVKLMDFGISKFTEETGGGRTGANVVMGTPEYMSPEQAAGAANVDARTDIWAMGVMLYRALTGVEPFRRGPRADRQLPAGARSRADRGGRSLSGQGAARSLCQRRGAATRVAALSTAGRGGRAAAPAGALGQDRTTAAAGRVLPSGSGVPTNPDDPARATARRWVLDGQPHRRRDGTDRVARGGPSRGSVRDIRLQPDRTARRRRNLVDRDGCTAGRPQRQLVDGHALLQRGRESAVHTDHPAARG
jgi:tRNA A-37 threonylcarbamoyl transferase component Bud32